MDIVPEQESPEPTSLREPGRKEERVTVRITHRQRTIGLWIVLGVSVVVAVYAWVVFITTLNFQVFPTDKFMVSLVGTTVLALFCVTVALMRTIRSWPHRQTTDRLCEQAVKLHRIIEHQNQLHCNPGYEVVPGDTYAATLHGRLTGIRMAICLLNDWDPANDADKEGPADELVVAYWEREHPADWASRR